MTKRANVVVQEHTTDINRAQSRSTPLPPPVLDCCTGSTHQFRAINRDHGDEESATVTIIHADQLIPGDGEPIPRGSLVIEDKLIVWVGKQADLPRSYVQRAQRTFSMPCVMPGLWEQHAHFLGGSDEAAMLGYANFHITHPAFIGAQLGQWCWEALQNGVTSMRDLAGLGCEISKVIEQGYIVGPNIYSAGAGLSQLAGHGDAFVLPAGDVLRSFGVSNVQPGHFGDKGLMIVDGVDECRRGVRLQIRRGAKCIKFMASGGVMSRDDNPLYQQFSDEEMETIVSEAHRQGRKVAAHAHGKPGILAAIKAGADTIEHGTFLDQECVDEMKKMGTILVGTQTVNDLLSRGNGEGYPPKQWEKIKLVVEHAEAAYKLAVKEGVTICLGADCPPSLAGAKELELAVKAGMTNLEAIKAATANGPLTVGEQAPKTGQLKAGFEADILGLTEDPVKDVKVLQVRDNIKYVFKGGRLFKGPGIGPWGEDYKPPSWG